MKIIQTLNKVFFAGMSAPQLGVLILYTILSAVFAVQLTQGLSYAKYYPKNIPEKQATKTPNEQRGNVSTR